MIGQVRMGGRTLHLLLALAFVGALLLRLAIPEGWMPVTGADGWRLTICTGTGPIDAMPGMAMPHGDNGDTADHHKSDHHPCPFTVITPAIVAPVVPPVAVVAPTVMPLPVPTGLIVTIGRGLAAPPPPPTGPPSTF